MKNKPGEMIENPVKTSQQRDYCYDFIRFVATILIVLSHVYSTASSNKVYNLPFMPLKLTMGGGMV